MRLWDVASGQPLAEFFGSEAGLSASTIQRLTREWSQELVAFQQRDVSQADYVYLRADGIHFNIRLDQERLCYLVLIGVRADGHKELIAVGDGHRESTESCPSCCAIETAQCWPGGVRPVDDGVIVAFPSIA